MSELRNLSQMNAANDGTRTLINSTVVPEVQKALKDWSDAYAKVPYVERLIILIGSLALSYHVKPRYTTDVDFLVIQRESVPDDMSGFVRSRSQAFMHIETNVEVELLSPTSLKLSPPVEQKVHDTAVWDQELGILVASRFSLIVLKLHRFSRQDQADIEALHQQVPPGHGVFGKLDLSEWKLSASLLARYDSMFPWPNDVVEPV